MLLHCVLSDSRVVAMPTLHVRRPSRIRYARLLLNAAITSGVVFALPSATAMLRNQRSCPMRRIALPSVFSSQVVFVPQRTGRQLCRRSGRVAAQNRFRRSVLQICSMGKTVGSRHIRKCDCRCLFETRLESTLCFQSSGKKCSAAHRANRERQSRLSGRHQCRPCSCRNAMSRVIDRQRQIGIELAEEKPRTGFSVDDVGVFANPADTGFLGNGLFEHRARCRQIPDSQTSHAFFQSARQCLQTCEGPCGSRDQVRIERCRLWNRRSNNRLAVS